MTAYLPTLSDLAVAALSILLFAAMTVVGAALGGRRRCAALDPLVGWAVLCLPFAVFGTLTDISFIWLDVAAAVIVAAAVALCAWRGIAPGSRQWLPYVALSLTFLAIVSPTLAYGWDQLSHWLPNANYLLAWQHFPRDGLPPIRSTHAGYPYGFALAIYGIEMLARALHVTAQPIGAAATLNVLLLCVAARLLAKKIAEIYANPIPPMPDRAPLGRLLFGQSPWLAAGLALLAVTALSPSFLPANSLSASADNATAIVLLAVALALSGAPLHGVQLAALLALNVFLKEDAAVPALALMIGRAAWDFRVRAKPAALATMALAALPMLALALLWHSFAFRHIPGGEMGVRAPAEWHPGLLPAVLLGMIETIVSKIGFSVCLIVTLVVAARALVGGNPDNATGKFAAIAAAGFLGYNLFLAFAYISIFAPAEALRVAALWRYETHLGPILEAAALFYVLGLVVRQRPIYARLAAPVTALMLLAPIVLAPVIRPDLDPQTRALRAVAATVDARGAGDTVYVIDQFGNGAPCPMLEYEARKPFKVAACVTRHDPCVDCAIRQAARDGNLIWSNGWTRALDETTGLSLPAGAWLIARTGDRWRVLQQWPFVPTRMRGVRAIWSAG